MPSPQPRSVDHSSLRRGEVLPRWQSFADFLHSLGEHYKKAQSPQTPASSESYGLLISRAFKRELTAPAADAGNDDGDVGGVAVGKQRQDSIVAIDAVGNVAKEFAVSSATYLPFAPYVTCSLRAKHIEP